MRDNKHKFENWPWQKDVHLTGANKVKTASFPAQYTHLCQWLNKPSLFCCTLQFCLLSALFTYFLCLWKRNEFGNDFLLDSTKGKMDLANGNYYNNNWWNYLQKDYLHPSKHLRKLNYVHWEMQMWNQHFPKWFTSYEDLFTEDLKKLADDWKVRFLLRNLKYSKYSNHPWDYK